MVIDSRQQLEQLKDRDLIVVPIPTDNRVHPTQTQVIALALKDIQSGQSYIVSLSHPEAVYHMTKTDIELLQGRLYCTNIPLMWNFFDNNTLHHSELYDYEIINYLHTNKKPETLIQPIITHYNSVMITCRKTNALVSLLKLQERVEKLTINTELPDGYEFYSQTLKRSLNWIQDNGLQINVNKFKSAYGRTFSRCDDKCYTQYNYYTTTGRPSNRFGGVNFAAIPKDKTRECFISRFGKNGSLVELDFNSYHPRLIASLVGYDFGKENVYEHLAKHYHNTPNPTKEQIKQAKEDTFRQLYGGINKEYLGIEFFKKTDDLARSLWSHMNKYGWIQSPLSGRKLILRNYKDLTLYTLFNYFIQMYETEHNAVIIQDMAEHWVQAGVVKSVPVLYTYDSVLFDIHKDEHNLVVNEVIPALIDLQRFPIKIKGGNNYANLTFC